MSVDYDLRNVTFMAMAKNAFHGVLSMEIKEKTGASFKRITQDELAFAFWAFGPDSLTILEALSSSNSRSAGALLMSRCSLLYHQEPRAFGSADMLSHQPHKRFRRGQANVKTYTFFWKLRGNF